ncbi:transcriptional regulator with XRE-family HTH domain [Haloactinopolyspora alba]|uniref:Transcriptional regulator with XRE-family HTH domain n=1 Tax=Haloactinopolyspora alba TaxID=648780 RepID=A0A2P8EFW9_9ACTN|nr:helix-turn-helix transcriptional regulator [Haloactinopolyspora alba]PSL08363.1 transcriptional regulator with XRE-family HTH domain [Haloactinopolyspora alba]
MTDDQPATVDEAPLPTPVGQRIRSRRLELGLSQAEIAEGMLSPSYVSLVESGRRQPAASALAHIAERLRIDVEYLRDGVDASVRTRARLALGRAEVALREGRAEEAYQQFTELMGDPGLNDEQDRQARLGRANARERNGDLEGAIELLNELADEARQSPEVQSWLDVAIALTRCYDRAGDFDMAIQVGEEARRAAGDLGLESTDEYIRLGCTVLGAYQSRGDLVRSKSLSAELVAAADKIGAPHTRGAAYWNASLVAESRGELALALNLVDRALAMFGEGDDLRNLARLKVAHAWLLLQGTEPKAQEALDILDGVAESIKRYGGSVDVAAYHKHRADALALLGRLDEAKAAVDESLRELGDQPRVGAALARLTLARIVRAQGDVDGSIREAVLAASMLESMGATRVAAAAWRELADLYRDLGRTDSAMDAYDNALRSVRVVPQSSGAVRDVNRGGLELEHA